MHLRGVSLSCLAILLVSSLAWGESGSTHRETIRQRVAGVQVSPQFRGLIRKALNPRAASNRPVTKYEQEVWVNMPGQGGHERLSTGKVPPRRPAKDWWGLKTSALDPFFLHARKGKSESFFDTTASWQYMRFPSGRSMELHVEYAPTRWKARTQDGEVFIRGRSGRILWHGSATDLMTQANTYASHEDHARLRRLTGFNPHHLRRTLEDTHLIHKYDEQKVSSELSARYASERRTVARAAIEGLNISSRLSSMIGVVLDDNAKNVRYQNWWGRKNVIEAKTYGRINSNSFQIFFGRNAKKGHGGKAYLWDVVAYRVTIHRFHPGQYFVGAAVSLPNGKTLEVDRHDRKKRWQVRDGANKVVASGNVSPLSKYYSDKKAAAQERRQFVQATGLSVEKMDRLIEQIH